MGFVNSIFNNRAITVPLIAWFAAQAIKVITNLLVERKIDFRRFIGSGGMPSSHSAFTVSLAIVVGRINGWDSTLFALAVAFAIVVMYDAAGVRRAAGKQAKVLNKLVYSHFTKIELEEKLKELLGHTPLEVFMGALLGLVFGMFLF